MARAEELRDFFKENLAKGEKIDMKQWKSDISNLDGLKRLANWKCDAYKDELRVAELLKDLFEEQAQEQQQEQEQEIGKKRGEER